MPDKQRLKDALGEEQVARIAAEAIDWVLILEDRDRLKSQDTGRHMRWLKQSPVHVKEMLLATCLLEFLKRGGLGRDEIKGVFAVHKAIGPKIRDAVEKNIPFSVFAKDMGL